MNPLNYDLTLWNRLDSRARNENFYENLKAEVRDPLWMLSRQWQFGEFEAEDVGAPIFARIDWNNTRINKISLDPSQESTAINQEIPLEAEVERVQIEPDIYLRVEMGRHFVRLLKKNLPAARSKEVITAFKSEEDYLFQSIPDGDFLEKYDNAYLLNNEALIRFLEAARFGKMLDGKSILDALEGTNTASGLIGQNDLAIDQVGVDFINWFKMRYSQPDNVEVDGWKPERLEYQCALAAPEKEDRKTYLAAEEYFQGRLDWYNFDIAEENQDQVAALKNESLDQTLLELGEKRHFIPSEIEFPGMPKARWWEFEDNQLNFAAIEANISDTAKMVLTEFAFLYSNDWFMLPYKLPTGSLMQVNQIVLSDNFGQRTQIEHYNKRLDDGSLQDPNWSFFKLDLAGKPLEEQIDQRLFIPPVVLDIQESKPIEEVYFTRDEMANYVWGIEAIIPDGLGKGIKGKEYADIMKEYFLNLVEEKMATEGIEEEVSINNLATIKYIIANTVPENWIPFIPAQKSESNFRDIHFQRAAMPRVLPGFPTKRVRPFTRLLRVGLEQETRAPYFICEEEIPRSGAIVRQTWQRARWHNGKVVLWSGYRKTNGRGEAASGLKFDQIIDKE
ncbi:MAG: hypothetical protein AAFO07_26090 [Bacteroidota bacterium]